MSTDKSEKEFTISKADYISLIFIISTFTLAVSAVLWFMVKEEAVPEK